MFSIPTATPCQADILLIDDDDDLVLLASTILKLNGFRVHTALSGKEALKLFDERKSQIDLVLLDYTLPDMRGEIIYNQLQKQNPAVKFIISSGYNAANIISQFGDRHFTPLAFLQKPYNDRQLIHAICQLLTQNPAIHHN